MIGPKIIQPKHSLKFKLLVLLLLMMFIATLVMTLFSIRSSQNLSYQSQQISAEALHAQAETSLIQLTEANAREQDLSLERIGRDAALVAEYAASLYNDPDRVDNPDFWPVQEHLIKGADGQRSNAASDPSSVFIPNFRPVDGRVRLDLELSAYLDLVVKPLLESNPSVKAVYFASANEVLRYYPNVELGKILPPDFRSSERIWYQGSTPEKRPEGGLWWTPIYQDATGLGLITTTAVPVYNQENDLVGVIGLDLSLNDMMAQVESLQFMQEGYSFLIDQSGHAIAMPPQGYQDVLGRTPEQGEVGSDLSNATPAFAPVLQKMRAAETGFERIHTGDQEFIVAFAPLNSTGWSIASVVPTASVVQGITTLQGQLHKSAQNMLINRLLPYTGLAIVALVLIALVWMNRLVHPLQALSRAATQIAAGQWDVGPLPASDDEIGVLSQTFRAMAQQLRELVTGLENRVTERTQALERRAFQLQVAADVARESASIRNVEHLLDFAVHLISERFGYYHAGIFLLDDMREFAILRAASSEGGQQMLARSHKLKVGEEGIVGFAAERAEPRIALDVGEDQVYFNNLELPLTRSEAALPMVAADKVIGVLDVQSMEAQAFSQEDLSVLQILADQLALAIQNARLLEESERSLAELEGLYRNQVRESWQQRLAEAPKAYSYDRLGVKPAAVTQVLSPAGGYLLDLPIELRGQPLGSFQLMRAGNLGPWRKEEIELAQSTLAQIAQALESARLFQEARQRAAREGLLNQMTTNISRSLDMDTLLRSALQELGKLPEVVEVSVHLTPQGNSQPEDGKDKNSSNGQLNDPTDEWYGLE